MQRALHIPQMAMFVAIALAFRAVPLPPLCGGLLRLAALPIILAGFILGPRAGFWVGAVSDVLECLLFPRGQMFFPGFTLTQALTGAIPALLVRHSAPNFWRYLGAIAAGQGLTKLVLVPLFILCISNVPDIKPAYEALLLQALITQAIHIPIYAWISVLAMRHLAPLIKISHE